MSLYGITVESAPDITTNGSGGRYPKILFRMTRKLNTGDPTSNHRKENEMAEWINAKDKQPKSVRQTVLCVWKNRIGTKTYYGFARFDKEYDSWWVANEGAYEVLYWMPLPKKPEEEE